MDFKSTGSVAEFFHEAISSALEHQGLQASEPTAFYLVNLLANFAHAPLDDAPLSLKLARAREASPDERARQLKEVGDTSLYVAGFFAESLERRAIRPEYYMELGGQAYGQLADFFRSYRKSTVFSDVYDELGAKFRSFVSVLEEIAASTSMGLPGGQGGPEQVVQLYERWQRTGSERLARRLRELGVLPPRGAGALH